MISANPISDTPTATPPSAMRKPAWFYGGRVQATTTPSIRDRDDVCLASRD